MRCNFFVTFDRFVKHVLELKVLLISKLGSKVCLNWANLWKESNRIRKIWTAYFKKKCSWIVNKTRSRRNDYSNSFCWISTFVCLWWFPFIAVETAKIPLNGDTKLTFAPTMTTTQVVKIESATINNHAPTRVDNHFNLCTLFHSIPGFKFWFFLFFGRILLSHQWLLQGLFYHAPHIC